MPIERVEVGNFMAWGKLVKTWATGEDYVKNGKGTYPRPKDLNEFRAQVESAGCEMTIPDRIKTLSMIPGDTETLVVRLPPGEMVKDSEAAIDQLLKILRTSKYPLPSFYDMAWGTQPQVSFDEEGLLCFHASRLGEYTINNCM